MEPEKSLFPCDITLEECYAATKGFPGFRNVEKFDHIIFNYDFAFRQSFPDPAQQETDELKRLMAIRRECRGIMFHKATGQILARRLHKFFNINEMEETAPHRIDVARPHVLLEKADGLRFGTKMGITEVSTTIEDQYLPQQPTKDYAGFSAAWIEKGYTPMFELCASKHQVILEYPEDIMPLIAIRRNSTGEYLPWTQLTEAAASYNVPIRISLLKFTPKVSPHTELVYKEHYSTAEELLAKIKALEGVEGGLMYKAKTDWYMKRSKQATSQVFHEKDIFEMVIKGTIDDFADMLGPKRLELIGLFGFELFANITATAKKIQDYVAQARENGLTDKKDFVAKVLDDKRDQIDPLFEFERLYFACYDGVEIESEIKKFILSHCSSSKKLDRIRDPICGGVTVSLNT